MDSINTALTQPRAARKPARRVVSTANDMKLGAPADRPMPRHFVGRDPPTAFRRKAPATRSADARVEAAALEPFLAAYREAQFSELAGAVSRISSLAEIDRVADGARASIPADRLEEAVAKFLVNRRSEEQAVRDPLA